MRAELLRGLPIGALSGVGGALIYYLLVALMDRRTYGTAIPASWVGMWLLIALLDGRWLRAPQRRPWGEIALRGVLAAGTERHRVLPGDEHALGPTARDRQELFRPVRRVGGCVGARSAGIDVGSITNSGFYALHSHESAGVIACKCSDVAWFGTSDLPHMG